MSSETPAGRSFPSRPSRFASSKKPWRPRCSAACSRRRSFSAYSSLPRHTHTGRGETEVGGRRCGGCGAVQREGVRAGARRSRALFGHPLQRCPHTHVVNQLDVLHARNGHILVRPEQCHALTRRRALRLFQVSIQLCGDRIAQRLLAAAHAGILPHSDVDRDGQRGGNLGGRCAPQREGRTVCAAGLCGAPGSSSGGTCGCRSPWCPRRSAAPRSRTRDLLRDPLLRHAATHPCDHSGTRRVCACMRRARACGARA